MSHQHLTIDQRNQLYQLRQEGSLSQRQMSVVLGCSQSTIGSKSILPEQTYQASFKPTFRTLNCHISCPPPET